MEKHQNPQYPLSPTLNPEKALPEGVQKSDVVKWEKRLKDQLGEPYGLALGLFQVLEGLRLSGLRHFCDAGWVAKTMHVG